MEKGQKGCVMAIEKLPNGKFRAVIVVCRKEGVRKRISKSFPTKKEASLWESQKKIEKARGTLQDLTESSTFYSVADSYLKNEVYSKSPNTIKSVKQALDGHILNEIGALQIHTISPMVIQNLQTLLIGKGLENKNVNYQIRIVSMIFKYAIEGLLQLSIKNPTKAINDLPVQREIKKVKYLNDTQLKTLQKGIKGNYYESLILFLINHGLRISEAAALQVNKYDPDEQSIIIDQQFHPYIARATEPKYKGAFVLGPLKSCNPRLIYLNKSTNKIIKNEIKNKKESEFIFKPKRCSEKDIRTIVLKRGNRPKTIKTHVINSKPWGFNKEVFRPIMESLDLAGFSVHNLRDTCGTHFYSKTLDLKATAELLGHKSTKTTEIYANVMITSKKRYAGVFEVGNE